MSHNLVHFQTDVLDRSQRVPVLVDFWAAWCGPCKMLGPVLEKLAAEADGRWVLIKIDTETHQDLAAQFGIRSIPDVKLFHRGAVVAEFSGALPEPQVRAWLAQHLPTSKRDTMARARELLHAGRAGEAAILLKPVLAADPVDPELLVLTARAVMFSDPAAASSMVAKIVSGSPWAEETKTVSAITAAFETLAHPEERLPVHPLRDSYLTSLRDLQAQRFRDAAAGVVGVLQERPDYDQGRAKAACLALFKHLGLRHPVTEEFARAYGMAVNI